MNSNSLQDLLLGAVLPSSTNPRKDFASPAMITYLEELASTIRQRGVLQPILVRPDYCVGKATTAAIAAARPAGLGKVQIVAGECRWRASKLAARATIPAIVQEMTDDDAREAQQIENLQRRNLSPIEEAQGLEDMLSLRDDAGAPRYSVESLAEKLGHKPDWVKKRRALLLLPKLAQDALDNGDLSPTVARLITALPDPQDRERYAKALVRPALDSEPLTYAAAVVLRDAEYVVPIKGVAFNPADAALVPEAGSCFNCPKYVGNRPDLLEPEDFKAGMKVGRCYDPRCYRSKIDAHTAAKAASNPTRRKRTIPAEEAAGLYPITVADGEMAPDSPYVQLVRRPACYLLKPEVSQPPTWEELVTTAEEKLGGTLERVLIPDQKGVVREHVDVKVAIAAIEKAGEPIFRGREGKKDATGPDLYTQQKAAEAEHARVQWDLAKRGLDLVSAGLNESNWWLRDELVDVVTELAFLHAGPGGLGLVAKWKGLHVESGEFGLVDAVKKWRDGLDAGGRLAVIPLLLLSPAVKMHGIGSSDLRDLAKALKIDLEQVKAAPVGGREGIIVRANTPGPGKSLIRPRSGRKPSAPKLTREQKIDKVRLMRAEKKNFAEIFMATKLPKKFLTKLLAEIDAGEGSR